MSNLQNSETPGKKRKGGRPARPPRCVITLKMRAAGVVVHVASMTVDCESHDALRRIQTAFANELREFRRCTDDPRWKLEG